MVYATPANDIESEVTGNSLGTISVPSSVQGELPYGNLSSSNGTKKRWRTPKGLALKKGSVGFGSYGRIEIKVGRCAREVMHYNKTHCQDYPQNPASPYYEWTPYPADTFKPSDFSLTTKESYSPAATSTLIFSRRYGANGITTRTLPFSGSQKEEKL
tara:strand:+ start:948 stop:1421 length:474 start_codon:yes stop_codon:yes gene_type:complete